MHLKDKAFYQTWNENLANYTNGNEMRLLVDFGQERKTSSSTNTLRARISKNENSRFITAGLLGSTAVLILVVALMGKWWWSKRKGANSRCRRRGRRTTVAACKKWRKCECGGYKRVALMSAKEELHKADTLPARSNRPSSRPRASQSTGTGGRSTNPSCSSEATKDDSAAAAGRGLDHEGRYSACSEGQTEAEICGVAVQPRRNGGCESAETAAQQTESDRRAVGRPESVGGQETYARDSDANTAENLRGVCRSNSRETTAANTADVRHSAQTSKISQSENRCEHLGERIDLPTTRPTSEADASDSESKQSATNERGTEDTDGNDGEAESIEAESDRSNRQLIFNNDDEDESNADEERRDIVASNRGDWTGVVDEESESESEPELEPTADEAAADGPQPRTPITIRFLPADITSGDVDTAERKRRFDQIVAALPVSDAVRSQLRTAFSNLKTIESARGGPGWTTDVAGSRCRTSSVVAARATEENSRETDPARCSASVCRDGNTVDLTALLDRSSSQIRSQIPSRPSPSSTSENSSTVDNKWLSRTEGAHSTSSPTRGSDSCGGPRSQEYRRCRCRSNSSDADS